MNQEEVIDELYEKTGNFGRAQCLMSTLVIIGLTNMSFITYSFGFLLQLPEYTCVLTDDAPDDFVCDKSTVCAGS